MLRYKNEDERIAAIEALDPNTPDYDDKFSEIQGAELGEADLAPPEEGNGEQAVPPVVPPAAPAEETVFTLRKEELPEGYSDPKQVLKSHNEQRELIKRQQEKIQELISGAAAQQPAPQAAQPKPPEKKFDEGQLATSYEKASQLEAELDALIAEDEDAFHTTEYQKKSRELTRTNTAINKLLNEQLSHVRSSTQEVTTYYESKKATDAKKASEDAANVIYSEIDSVTIPELKTSRKSKEVESDYYAYRDKMAQAYFGRTTNLTEADKAYAYSQALAKNPMLAANCSVMGFDIEPTEDVAKYIEWCKVLDYRNGIADPVTGRPCGALTMFDDKSGTHVPLPFDKAVEAYRTRTGFYKAQVDTAYQRGATSAAMAAMRRDKGAVELGDEGQRAKEETPLWANAVINRINIDKALAAKDRGDSKDYDELNRAYQILGIPEL